MDQATIQLQLKKFWEKGYMLLQSAIPPDVAAEALEKATTLAVDSERFGNNQLQAPLRGQFKAIKAATAEVVKQLRMKWLLRNWVAVKSMPGGDEQDAYRDFPSCEIKTARQKNRIQGILIVGLMRKTRLVLYEACFTEADPTKRKVIEFDAGDIVILRGDLVHAGASYPVVNLQLHCVLQVKGVDAGGATTEMVPTTVRKCPFCRFLCKTALQVRNHLRYCRANPRHDAIKKTRNENNERPTTCPICGAYFPRQANYYQHKKRKHGKLGLVSKTYQNTRRHVNACLQGICPTS